MTTMLYRSTIWNDKREIIDSAPIKRFIEEVDHSRLPTLSCFDCLKCILEKPVPRRHERKDKTAPDNSRLEDQGPGKQPGTVFDEVHAALHTMHQAERHQAGQGLGTQAHSSPSSIFGAGGERSRAQGRLRLQEALREVLEKV